MTLLSNRTTVHISCLSIEYLLKVLPTIGDWLNACVAIERAVAVSRGFRYNKNESKRIAKKIVILLIIMNMVSGIHDPVNRSLTDDPQDQRTW
ncbi:unnamed protein product, partial [Didymodactylos carnosus]